MRMEKAIVTGADGFVGSHTVKYFLDNGVTVLAIGRLDVPKRLEAHPLLTYLQADVSETGALVEAIPKGVYDTFVHFAWTGSAGPRRFDYRLQMENALQTVDCLKAAASLGCGRFVCAGSIMEKEIEAAVHSRGAKPGMGYVYGIGKHTAHFLCQTVAAEAHIDLIWPMITNAYGIGEYSPRFINTTLRKIFQGEPLQFTAATQNYDFVYVTDVARAFYLIAQKGKPFCEYTIGSGNARPLRAFLLEMGREICPDREMVFGDIPYTGVSMPLSAFSTDDLQNDCGYRAEIPFSEGTRMVYEWIQTFQG